MRGTRCNDFLEGKSVFSEGKTLEFRTALQQPRPSRRTALVCDRVIAATEIQRAPMARPPERVCVHQTPPATKPVFSQEN
jgi:hypothetical protein